MQILYQYSGLFVIASAWLFLILPFLFLRKKYLTISHAGLESRLALYINSGVILAGVFQIVFSVFLSQNVQNNYSTPGSLLLTFGGLSFVLAGFLNKKKTFKIHSFIIKIYSLSTIFGTTLISFHLNRHLLLIVLILIVGSIYFYVKKKYFLSEVWTILFFSLWTKLLYLLLL